MNKKFNVNELRGFWRRTELLICSMVTGVPGWTDQEIFNEILMLVCEMASIIPKITNETFKQPEIVRYKDLKEVQEGWKNVCRDVNECFFMETPQIPVEENFDWAKEALTVFALKMPK